MITIKSRVEPTSVNLSNSLVNEKNTRSISTSLANSEARSKSFKVKTVALQIRSRIKESFVVE